MIGDERLRDLAGRLTGVSGVVAVMLGGSRARGTQVEKSDVDLGLYYRNPLDVGGLTDLAREVTGRQAQLTSPGGWGPWVDGGGWLRIDETAVDWIYRDLDRVHATWSDAKAGRYSFHFQVGHPLGVPDFSYPAEVALGVVLADPTGELTSLQEQVRHYPARLGEALVTGLWEAHFALESAMKAVTRRDSAYVAGCLFRVVLLCAHALHGQAGRWLTNEKGAISSAGRLRGAPADFEVRCRNLLGRVGVNAAELTETIRAASDLVAETAAACQVSG